MTGPITTELHDDVLVIISNNPPVNALGAAVRQGLEAGIKEGLANDAVKAMVIRCDGRTFFAGADITEFGRPMQEPGLPTVVDMIEMADKPVVAAIHGTALGGGCEVTLGCHYHIAVPSAKSRWITRSRAVWSRSTWHLALFRSILPIAWSTDACRCDVMSRIVATTSGWA